MAFDPNTSTAVVRSFRGSANSQDSYNIDPEHGLFSLNLDFFLGLTSSVQCGTRRGTSQVSRMSPNELVPSMDSWYFVHGGVENCYAVFYGQPDGVRAWDQLNQVFVPNLGTSGLGGVQTASWAFDGARLYTAYTDFSGRKPLYGGEVYGIGTSLDPLFPPGLSITDATVALIPSAIGGNAVTIGTHRIVVFITTRNGYFGPLNYLDPDFVKIFGSAYQFVEAHITGPNNTISINVTITVPVPSWLVGATYQVAMTPATNPAHYFLIGGIDTPVGAQGVPVTIQIGISDSLLVQGTDATDFQNNFGSNVPILPYLSHAQIKPSSIFQYSSRAGYITQDSDNVPVVYFSTQNAYQQVSMPFGGIYLEGRQIPVQGVSLGGTCYIATLSGLYSTQDNGGLPATWTPPAHIDGSVGCLAPSCVVSVGGKILIASEKGLYLFRGGAFPQIPISYFQSSDWNRINWSMPTQVQIVDDSYDKVIRVLAPLNVIIFSVTNTNPIQVTTGVLVNGVPKPLPHLFQDLIQVQISGVLGTTSANGLHQISVTGPNTFTISVAGNGAYVPGASGWSGTAAPQGANAQMCWAYPAGDSPGEPFYSLQAFSSYRIGAMATVRNIQTGVDEVWFAPTGVDGSSHQNLIRRVLPTDSQIHRDVDYSGNPALISALYQTSNLPGSQDESGTIHDFHGMHLRATGQGGLALGAQTLDQGVSIVPVASPLALSQGPAREYLVKWALRSEQQTLSFGSNAIDEFFVLSLVKAYYSFSVLQR